MNAITPAALAVIDEHVSTPGRPGVELLYQPSESLFGASAPEMWEQGWSVMPQTIDRMPGSVRGDMIKWGSGKDGLDLANCVPDQETRRRWVGWCGHNNTACVFGAASGHTFAIDIDVLDEGKAQEIVALADETFGHTPLRREGRFPKIALIYRHAPDDVVPSCARWIADADGNPGEHGIEVLGAGKLLTFHGKHHKTGTYFSWLDKNPQMVGPDAAPLVTAERVTQFLNSVDMLHGFADRGRSQQRQISGPAGEWSPDGAAGGNKATDGREQALFSLVNTTVTSFDPDFWKAVDGGDAELFAYRDAKLVEICDRFAAANEMTGRWAPDRLAGEALGRLNHWIGGLCRRPRPPADKMRKPKAAGAAAVAEAAKGGEKTARAPFVPPNDLPVIQVRTGELVAAVDAAEDALIKSGRGVYQRTGALCTVAGIPIETRKGKPIVALKIIPKSNKALAEDLSASATWCRYNPKKDDLERTDVPQRVVDTLEARVGRWRIPQLDGIISAPMIRLDGTVLDQAGYDRETALLYDPQGVEFPKIPGSPTMDDATVALGKLKNLLATFPFVAPQDLSAALSGILTAVVRRSLGVTPIHTFTAPVPGSGKSMLVDLVSILVTGHEAAVISQGQSEEEFEKRMSAALRDGDPIISIDNVVHPLGGPFLNQVTTQRVVKPRILGKSEVPDIRSNASVYATGNNLVLFEDMVRRALLCSLDPCVERPEQRVFKNDPIADCKRDRGELVVAAITIMRAHALAGYPRKHAPIGGYGDWSRIVRDALTWLGEADPWLTTERARELDPQLDTMTCILTQWLAVIKDARVTVAEALKIACEQVPAENGAAWARDFRFPEFREALLAVAGEGGAVNTRRLGKWLLRHAGRIVHGMQLVKDGERSGVAVWKIKTAAGEAANATVLPESGLPDFQRATKAPSRAEKDAIQLAEYRAATRPSSSRWPQVVHSQG